MIRSVYIGVLWDVNIFSFMRYVLLKLSFLISSDQERKSLFIEKAHMFFIYATFFKRTGLDAVNFTLKVS